MSLLCRAETEPDSTRIGGWRHLEAFGKTLVEARLLLVFAPMRPPRFVVGLYAFDLFLGALAITAGVVSSAMGIEGFDFVRLGSEANLPAWYSSSQLLAVAALAAVAVWPRVTSGEKGARWALAPAAFFVLLSLDEGGQVHERVGAMVEGATALGAGLNTGPWLLVMAPFYGVLAWLIWRAVRPLLQGRRAVVLLSGIGGALFLISAVGFEGLGNLVAGDGFALRVLGVFEEVGEMVAATTFLWAAWMLVRAEGVVLAVQPTDPTGRSEALVEKAPADSGADGAPLRPAPSRRGRPQRHQQVR